MSIFALNVILISMYIAPESNCLPVHKKVPIPSTTVPTEDSEEAHPAVIGLAHYI